MKIPVWRPWSSGSPQRIGSFALSTMSFEIGTEDCASFWSGPPSPKRNDPIQIAIQLSMIVEITSCAPTVALRNPAIPAQTAPASVATTIASVMCSKGFIPSNDEPIHTAQMAPTMYCPCPPMLKSPQRKANATARPTRMNVVV